MSAYPIVLFLHIVGTLGLFVAFGLEWAGLINLRKAKTLAQVREWVRMVGAIPQVGVPALLTVISTGIIMTASRWGWQGWIGVAIAAMVPLPVLGAMAGRRMRRIARALPTEQGFVSTELAERLRDRMFLVSAWLRTALGLAIVFMMSNKPSTGGAFAAMGVALVLGTVAGLAPQDRGRRAVLMEAPRPDA